MINDSTTEIIINQLDPVQAYHEYFLVFGKGSMPFHDIIMLKPDDVKLRLIDYIRELKEKLDTLMDDVTGDNELNTQSLDTSKDSVTLFLDSDVSTQNDFNILYDRILALHEEQHVSTNDSDDNILSILGPMTESDIQHLSQKAVREFVCAIYRLDEENCSPAHIQSLKMTFCRQLLRDERSQMSVTTVNKKNCPLLLQKLSKHSVRLLTRSQLLILLYNSKTFGEQCYALYQLKKVITASQPVKLNQIIARRLSLHPQNRMIKYLLLKILQCDKYQNMNWYTSQ